MNQKGYLKLLPLALLVVFVLITTIGLVLTKKKNTLQLPQQDSQQRLTEKLHVPKIKIASYSGNLAASKPTTPQPVYTLKNQFTDSEIAQFAQRFGLDQQLENTPKIAAYASTTKLESLGAVSFDKQTGAFSYRSFGTFSVAKGTTLQDTALQAIQLAGFTDDTITCPVTYQKKSIKDVTFVECHRDWQKLGAPLVTLPGVLNIPENELLAHAKVGMVDSSAPNDTDIINTSTKQDGKVRPNDFNTITIGLYSDGRVASVDSNLRWITSKKALQPSQYIAPQEAITLAKLGKQTLTFAVPAGSGTTNWNTVFPDKLSKGTNTHVTDVTLIYLEQPASEAQPSYEPYYLIRGITTLDTGYTVKFDQVVKATKPGIVTQVSSYLAYLAETALADDKPEGGTNGPVSIDPIDPNASKPIPRRDTFDPPPPPPQPQQPVTQPQPQTPTNPFDPDTDSPIAPRTPQCSVSNEQIPLVVPGYGTIYIAYSVAGFGTQNLSDNYHSFYVVGSNVQQPFDIEKVRDAFINLVAKQYAILIARQNIASAITSQDIKRLLSSTDNSYERNSNRLNKIRPDVFTNVEELTFQLISEAQRTNSLRNLANEQNVFDSHTLDQDFSDVLMSIFLSGGAEGVPGQGECQYLSGVSPIIYIYPHRQLEMKVAPQGELTYTDPHNSWEVIVQPNGLLTTSDGIQRDKLYYEYAKDSVSFFVPEEGYLATPASLETLVRLVIAPQLRLNAKETSSLVQEVTNALGQTQTPFLKVSVADQKELNQKLPLTIQPEPTSFVRIHLLLTPINQSQSFPTPLLTPIQRDSFTVVELGARLVE